MALCGLNGSRPVLKCTLPQNGINSGLLNERTNHNLTKRKQPIFYHNAHLKTINMSNTKDLMIQGAAKILQSSEFTVRCDASNIPATFFDLSKYLNIDVASKALAAEIRSMRDAERDFFRSHPELNP